MPNAGRNIPAGLEPSFPYPRWSDGWCPAGAPSGKGSGKSPLHDVNDGNDGSRLPRIDAEPALFNGENCSFALSAASTWELVSEMVEPDGIEPTTSCLQSRRSPN